jgi:uncharacterized protein YlxW (UPF0749 family)
MRSSGVDRERELQNIADGFGQFGLESGERVFNHFLTKHFVLRLVQQLRLEQILANLTLFEQVFRKTSNKAQSNNTALLLNSFKDLSQRVSDLQSQVSKEALQKKLASVQAALQSTQKALTPGPKAQCLSVSTHSCIHLMDNVCLHRLELPCP